MTNICLNFLFIALCSLAFEFETMQFPTKGTFILFPSLKQQLLLINLT